MTPVIDIPDLKSRFAKKQEKRRFAVPPLPWREAALIAVLSGTALGARGLAHWRAAQARLEVAPAALQARRSGDWSRLHLALPGETLKGAAVAAGKGAPLSEAAPSDEAAGRGQAKADDWGAVLDAAFGSQWSGHRARALARSAAAQLRTTDAVSGLAAGASAESAATLAEDAFAQRLSGAGGIPVGASVIDPERMGPRQPLLDPAPSNDTPYQPLLDRAYALAKGAADLRRSGPLALAAGTALLALGRALLGAPGAGVAARGMILAGLAAISLGGKKLAQARRDVAEAHRLVEGVELVSGRRPERALADICVDLLARGEKLERCQKDGPAVGAAVRAAVNRELSEHATWETEPGIAVN